MDSWGALRPRAHAIESKRRTAGESGPFISNFESSYGAAVNPYEAPQSEEPAPKAPNPESTQGLIVMFGLACAGILVRWVLEVLRVPFVEWWAPPLIGLLVGGAAARALPSEPDRQWMLLALVATGVALGIGALLPLPGGAEHLIAVGPNVGALVIAGANVARVKRASDAVESALARDADQRALFARRDIRAPVHSTAAAKFACAGCGELFVETELTTIDGRRRCASCAD
jgi:hypothetical protein